MLKFIVIFVLIGSVLCQDSEPDATCNPQPIVNYNFGPIDVPPASLLNSNNQPNIAQGRPGRIGPRGFLGPKGEKGEQGQTDESREDLRLMQIQLDELKAENSQLQSQNHIQEVANNLTRQILLRGFVELDDGWISPLNGYQYKVNRTSQTWDESRAMCQNLGGDLIVHGFQDPRTRLTITRAFRLSNTFWIGLSDKATEGTWQWVNGYRAHKDDDSLWYSNRPYTGSSRSKYDCGRSYFRDRSGGSSLFFVYDVDCSLTYWSICEKLI